MRAWFAVLVCFAAAAQEAPPPPIEIRGVITEVGANLPLADANVTVSDAKGNPLQSAKTTTDSQGAFRLLMGQLGTYEVRVAKAGYTDDGIDPAGEGASNRKRVTLDKDHRAAETRFRLARAGELRGLVLDDETGKPISHFKVSPLGIFYYHGDFMEMGNQAAVTDEDGRFVAKGLRPGKYLVEIFPDFLGKETMLTEFTEADLKEVDNDYRDSYWPGGGGLSLALPVEVLPGGIADVGTIRARKLPHYRIHVLIAAGECKEGEPLFLDSESPDFIAGGAGGNAKCGKDVLLRNYQPGMYEIHAMSGDSAQNRMRTVTTVVVVDKNTEATVSLARGADIEGHVVVADGSAKPPMDKIKVNMWSTGPIQYPDERAPAVPDGEGRFVFPNRPLARVRVWVTGLPSTFLVREFRYNGSHVVDNIVALNPNAPHHALEVVIDDKPASLSGTVADGDHPIGKAHVVIIHWPASSEDVFLSAKSLDGDDNGAFQVAGLAPGEYRILAVAPDTARKLDEPHVLERLLSGSEKIELSAGESQRIALKLTDPGR